MAASVWYTSPLTCAHCHSYVAGDESGLFTAGLSPDGDTGRLGVGEVLAGVGEADLLEAFPPRSRRPQAAPLDVLEVWDCPVCGTTEVVRLTFAPDECDAWWLVAQRAQLLDDTVLEAADGLSRMLRITLGGDFDVT